MPQVPPYPIGPTITIQDVLQAPFMAGIIQTTVSGIPTIFPPEWFDVEKTSPDDTFRFTQYAGQRQLAPLASFKQPAPKVQLTPLGLKDGMMVTSRFSFDLQPEIYNNMFAYDSLSKQEEGKQEIARQLQQHRELQDNTRVAALQSILFNGVIYSDNEGNILPSSSGAVNTASMNIPSGNQGQLDIFGTGNPIISAPWDLATTNIPQQITNLKVAAMQQHGYLPRCAFYGPNITQYFAQNNFVKDYLSRNAASGETAPGTKYMVEGDMPDRLFGLDWYPAYLQNWVDQGGNTQTIVAPGTVLFTPAYSKKWFAVFNGTLPCPIDKNLMKVNDGITLNKMVEFIGGRSAYAELISDPASIKIVMQDCFMPILKINNVIYQATVFSQTFS